MSEVVDHAKWEQVVGSMDASSLCLDPIMSESFFSSPKKLLSNLAVFKFVSKMVGAKTKILQLGLDHALGALVLEKECGSVRVVSKDNDRVDFATKNWPNLDVIKYDDPKQMDSFDAIFFNPFGDENFVEEFIESPDVYISILETKGLLFLTSKPDQLDTHNVISTQLKKFFRYSFVFSISGEIIQPGIDESAELYISVGCLKKC